MGAYLGGESWECWELFGLDRVALCGLCGVELGISGFCAKHSEVYQAQPVLNQDKGLFGV